MVAIQLQTTALRMHGKLLKLGIDVGPTSVTKYMARFSFAASL
jgi:hypothetical protein